MDKQDAPIRLSQDLDDFSATCTHTSKPQCIPASFPWTLTLVNNCDIGPFIRDCREGTLSIRGKDKKKKKARTSDLINLINRDGQSLNHLLIITLPSLHYSISQVLIFSYGVEKEKYSKSRVSRATPNKMRPPHTLGTDSVEL